MICPNDKCPSKGFGGGVMMFAGYAYGNTQRIYSCPQCGTKVFIPDGFNNTPSKGYWTSTTV